MAQPGSVRGDRLADLDIARHNADVRAMWQAFNAGTPTRVPVILGTNTRFFMLDPAVNADGYDFRSYSEDPDVMFDAQLAFQRWQRFNLLQDAELGLPTAWHVAPDFQNYYEAAWFGCPIEFMASQVPDTTPAFADAPERVLEQGAPDPFGGIMARAREFHEAYVSRAARTEFAERPVEAGLPWCGLGTDGPMTVACNLFGPAFVCEAMLAEPERLHRLLTFITDATIARMTAWRELAHLAVPQDYFGFADDSVALISTPQYVEHILPYHAKLCAALGTAKGRSIHLCGDATRHFLTIRDQLGVESFDTGFPVDFGALRRTLGPQVKIQGGPHVELLLSATPAEVAQETRRILQSGVLEGGRFVLREGNNLAPLTPLENTEAMYRAGLRYGRFGA